MVTDEGAIYITSNRGYNWKAAVQETVSATLNRYVASKILYDYITIQGNFLLVVGLNIIVENLKFQQKNFNFKILLTVKTCDDLF